MGFSPASLGGRRTGIPSRPSPDEFVYLTHQPISHMEDIVTRTLTKMGYTLEPREGMRLPDSPFQVCECDFDLGALAR